MGKFLPELSVVSVHDPQTGPDAGVTELLAELAADVPFAFVAVAVNVYAVPSVNPVKV